MPLRLPEQWVWDFWFAREGSDYHLFYLQADRSLQQESLRHWNVSIGHAVSTDLRQWEVLPDALRPSSDPDAFDNYTTWTGSIIRHDSLWHLFYTGSKRQEDGLIQRIGLAVSHDLLRWEKYSSQALIEADPRWYETLDRSAWHDQAWRDPYVLRDPATGQFHAFITARSKHGAADARAVIGHAVSDDLLHWDVQPPLTEPGEFGQMEVPQVTQIGERYYLLFCVADQHTGAARKIRLGGAPQTGTHYLAADHPLGPYRYLNDTFLVGDPHGSLYSGKLIQLPDQTWGFMGFANFTTQGDFVGEISDPLPVTIAPDGQLKVTRS